MKIYYSKIFKKRIELLYIGFFSILLFIFFLFTEIFGVIEALKILLGLITAVGVLYLVSKKNIYGLWFLLILFYFIPYQSPDYLARIGERLYFSLFKRFNSILCIWDVLIFSLAAFLIINRLVKGKLNFVGIQYKEIRLYIYLMIFAFINGFLHVSGSFLSFGPTEFLRPIISFMPFFYLIFMYLLTVNLIESKKDLDRTYNFIWILTILLIFYSIYRLIGILSGRFDALMMFGLPMILYDQMSLIFYPIFLYISLYLLKVKSKKKNILVALSLFLIILSSTRRFNYIILISGFFITLFLIHKVKRIGLGVIVKNFLKILIFLLIIFLVIILLLPDFVIGVYDSVKSIYFLSEYSLSYGGDIRKAELENMFLNMNKREYSYLVGYGLGTRWEEIIDVPFDGMSHEKKEMNKGFNWWPQFHVPYFSLIYVYGILGFLFMIAIVLMFLKRSVYFIKKFENKKYYQAQIIAITAYLVLTMFFLGGSFNPTGAIFCGILYGLQVSTNKYGRKNA